MKVTTMVMTSSGVVEKVVEECETKEEYEMVRAHFEHHMENCIGCKECREFQPDF